MTRLGRAFKERARAEIKKDNFITLDKLKEDMLDVYEIEKLKKFPTGRPIVHKISSEDEVYIFTTNLTSVFPCKSGLISKTYSAT